MDTTIARGLGIRRHAQFLEQIMGQQCCLAHLLERHSGHWIKVDTQFICVRRICGQVRPRMEPQTTKVHRPQHMSHVGHHQCVGRGAVRSFHHCGLYPLRSPRWHPLLKKRLALSPIGEALQHGRSTPHGRHERSFYAKVEPHQVQFCMKVLGEEHLVGMGNNQRSSGCLHFHALVTQPRTATVSSVGLLPGPR